MSFQSIKTTNKSPLIPIYSHTATFCDNKIVIFGGKDADKQCHNQIYIFHLQKNT